MVFGDNARTLNKMYELIKGNTKGKTRWIRENILPVADCENETHEVSPEQAYEIAIASFPGYIESNRLKDWKDVENYLLVKYDYSSTLTPRHLMKQTPPLICGAYKHGMNVARQCRWAPN